jgi:hypothetical protein
MEAINKIFGDGECLSDDGVIAEEVKRLTDFLHISGTMFVSRDANMAAHSVARFVAHSDGRFSWLEIGHSSMMSFP